MSFLSPYEKVDIEGEPLRRGDKVLVLAAPLSIQNMETETKAAFSRAIGRMLQVEGFGKDGSVELEMNPPSFKGWDTIWLEPFLVRRVCWGPLPRSRKKFSHQVRKVRRKQRAAWLGR